MTKHALIQRTGHDTKAEEPVQDSTQILVEVVYGLASRDCKGMGICKINAAQSIDPAQLNSSCNASLAYLQVLNAATIRFDFLKTSITAAQFAQRFASGSFLLEEPFYFSTAILSKLAPCGGRIPEGAYPILHRPEFISIDFLLG